MHMFLFLKKIVGSLKKKSRPTTQSGSRRSFLHFRLFPTTKLKQAACCLLEKSLSSGEFSRLKKHFNIFAHIVVHMKKEQLEEKSVFASCVFPDTAEVASR